MITTTNLSPNHYSGHQGPVVFIGIHTMEAPEGPQTAENVANYFKNPSVQASAHWCVDTDSRVRCVNDADSAWTMPPVNGISVNVEMAGYAADTATQWAAPEDKQILENVAVCVAEWCRKFSIPVRHLNSSQISTRERGIVGHVDVNNVFHVSDHWDPGPNFPWTYFLSRVNAHMGIVPPPPPPGVAPPWPLAADDYLGTPRPDPHCHSGYYSDADKKIVFAWQSQMAKRGWTIGTDGLYGTQSENVCRQFQLEKHLQVDGFVGPVTWKTSWTAPVT